MQLKIVVYLLLAALLVSIVNYISLFIDEITNSKQMIHYQPSKEVQKPALETFPSQSIGLWQTRQLRRPARRPPSPIKAPPINQRRQPIQRPPSPPRKESIRLPPPSTPLLMPSLLENLPSQYIRLWQTGQLRRPARRPPSPIKAPPINQRRLPIQRPPAPIRAPPRKESIILPPCSSPPLLTPSLLLPDLESLPSKSFVLRQTRQQRRTTKRPPSPIKAPPINQRSQPVQRPPAPIRAPPRKESIILPPCSPPLLTPSLPLSALENLPSQSFVLRQTRQQRRPAQRPPSPIKAPPINQRRLPTQRPPAPVRAPPHKESISLPPSSPPLLTPSFSSLSTSFI